MDINELQEIAKGFGIEMADCENLWRIESACKFYVIRDKNTGKGNLIGVGTQDEICFKNLANYSYKNSILTVAYDKKDDCNDKNDLKYAFIDTKTGRLIAQGENLFTGDKQVDDDIEKFMCYYDFIGTFISFNSKTFELAPKFIKKAIKVIKAELKNVVENWDSNRYHYLYSPFSKQCEHMTFSDVEECKLYIDAVLYAIKKKMNEVKSNYTVDEVKDILNNL